MRTQLTNFCVLFFLAGPLTGCQSAKNFQQAADTRANADVHQNFGPVDVLKGKNSLFPSRNKSVVAKIRLAGYESRNVGNVVKLRHQSGKIAEVAYFTEVTNDTIGVGKLKYRKSGDARAIVSIDDQVVGECSFRNAAIELATLSYAKPHARTDGEEVVVGQVVAGTMKLTVVSRCEETSDRGAVAAFFAGEDLKIWHEYRFGDQVVAQRILKPQSIAEFSRDLSPTQQLCIVADMNYRLAEERQAEAAANTIYVPVPAPR